MKLVRSLPVDTKLVRHERLMSQSDLFGTETFKKSFKSQEEFWSQLWPEHQNTSHFYIKRFISLLTISKIKLLVIKSFISHSMCFVTLHLALWSDIMFAQICSEYEMLHIFWYLLLPFYWFCFWNCFLWVWMMQAALRIIV